jgi:hypothetical protein
MSIHVYQTMPADPNPNVFTRNGMHYFEDTKLSFAIYSGSVSICDITDAGKSGKKCPSFKFNAGWAYNDDDTLAIIRLVFDYAKGDLKTLFNEFSKHTPGQLGEELEIGGIKGTLYFSLQQANRVYSPFAVYKPLTALPEKWTIPYMVRALATGQAVDVRCTGTYTDDYYGDACTNYGKGSVSAHKLMKRLVESPSGWWVHTRDGNEIGVHLYQFDNYSFRFVLVPENVPDNVQNG